MCTHKRYIVNAIGKSILVPCGHCPACMQDKAIKRTNRIRNNNKSGQACLFVTLTYSNHCVPYFSFREVDSSEVYQETEDDMAYREVNIYRNCIVRYNRVDSSYNFKRRTSHKRVCLGTYCVPECLLVSSSFTPLRNSDNDRVGVLFYKDVQDYIKRVRITLTRKYHYNERFSYFSCAEYGPTTCRPHFHLLFFVPSSDVSLWKSVLSASWSFDDYRRTADNIQIAIDASSYVSSYVNCDSTVPPLFRYFKSFAPNHSYSQGFGVAKEFLSLPSVQGAYERRDLHIPCARVRNGITVIDTCLLPSYVIRRYFPKFKGYGRLTPAEVESICLRPSSIREYSVICNLSKEDCHAIEVMLRNKVSFAASQGIDRFSYARAYANIWSVYYSNILVDSFKRLNDSPNIAVSTFYNYDNIIDYYSGYVGNDGLDDLMFHLPDNFDPIVDPNDFPSNISSTNQLTSYYHSYSKDRKVRNMAYSSAGHHV